MKIGIRKTLKGYQVWFKVDNQTFYLDEHVEDTDNDSLEVAQFFERMLKVAFEKIVNKVNKVNRVEVIDQNGRSFVSWKPNNKTEISLQDEGKTLKVFISNK